jgi:hypothetical protein
MSLQFLPGSWKFGRVTRTSNPNTIRTETHFYALKKIEDGYTLKILNDLWKRMRDLERNRVTG